MSDAPSASKGKSGSRSRPSSGGGGGRYGSYWGPAGEQESSALATTYVTSSEADYVARGRWGDANSFGAETLVGLAGLDRSSRVLEIGCGMARVGREMAPLVGEWHGADISAGMLERAARRTAHLANVVLHPLGEDGLTSFADASFDFVYATTVFMHLDKEDLFQYLVEMRRVLKDGRMAFFDTWNLAHPDTYRQWRQSQHHNQAGRKSPGRIQFSTAAEIRCYLDDLGWEPVRVDEDRLLRVLCRKGAVRPHEPDDGLPPFGCVDFPPNAAELPGSVGVWGWALDAVERVELVVDGTRSAGTSPLDVPRPDVAPLFPRYPGAATCGFRIELDLRDLEPGLHTLQAIAIDRNGKRTDLSGQHRCFSVTR